MSTQTTRGSVASWRDAAACIGLDPIFDAAADRPLDTTAADQARAACIDCPVIMACLTDAMQAEGGRRGDDRYGIRGGIDGAQRSALYRTMVG